MGLLYCKGSMPLHFVQMIRQANSHPVFRQRRHSSNRFYTSVGAGERSFEESVPDWTHHLLSMGRRHLPHGDLYHVLG